MIDKDIVNCILVECNARKAYYMQLNFKKPTDDNVIAIINNLKQKFPSLLFKYIDNFGDKIGGAIYNGYLISKIPIDPLEYDTSLHLGQLLGYPCASEDFEQNIFQDIRYGIQIYFIGRDTKEFEIQIFGNSCKTNKKQQFDILGQSFADCFKTHALSKDIFEKIKITLEPFYKSSFEDLFKVLKNNETLTQVQQQKILDYLQYMKLYNTYNYLNEYKNSAFINNNKILLMLLYLYKYQILDDTVNIIQFDIDIYKMLYFFQTIEK